MDCDAVRPLEWSKPKPPTFLWQDEHIEALTPFGSFIVSQREWATTNPACIERTPWGGWHGVFDSLEHAKEAAQAAFCVRVLGCLKTDEVLKHG